MGLIVDTSIFVESAIRWVPAVDLDPRWCADMRRSSMRSGALVGHSKLTT